MENFERQRIDVSRLPLHVVEKWSPAALSEGFVPLPKRLIRCLPQLFPNAEMEELSAILAVADYKRPNLSRLPSLEYLAFLSGLEVQTFELALERLQEKHFIKVSGSRDELDISLFGLLEAVEKTLSTGGSQPSTFHLHPKGADAN